MFVAAFLLCAVGLFHAADASARQCVFNKGGYVLKVMWYRPADLGLNLRVADSKLAGQFLPPIVTPNTAPIHIDTLTAGFGACTKTDEVLTALFVVPGCIAAFTAGNMVSGSSVECGKGWIWYAVGTQTSLRQPWCVAASGYCSAFSSGTPYLFLVATPSTSRYLDFWGSFADVHWGPGGPVQ